MNFEVVLTCAVTGAGDTVGKSDKVPVSAKEIADDAIESAKISSRRYAKRQLTWLRSLDDEYKLDPLDKQKFKTIEGIINNHFEDKD